MESKLQFEIVPTEPIVAVLFPTELHLQCQFTCGATPFIHFTPTLSPEDAETTYDAHWSICWVVAVLFHHGMAYSTVSE